MPASCCQVPMGRSTPAPRRSRQPSASGGHRGGRRSSWSGIVGASAPGAARTPSGPVSTTSAPSWSWPSRKTVRGTGNGSPTDGLRGLASAVDDRGDVHGLGCVRPCLPTLANRGRSTQTGPRSATERPTLAGGLVTDGSLRIVGRSKRSAVSVLPCAPSDDSPSAPSCPSRSPRWATSSTNLRWSWHPETQDVFAAIDPSVWAAAGTTRSSCSAPCRPRAARRAGRRQGLPAPGSTPRRPTWSSTSPATAGTSEGRRRRRRGRSPTSRPEFGITAVLPQYSGGLGILAGDHLKTASDLGVPLIGVGLLYRHGYFRQSLSREGWQQETYPVLDPDGLPIALLREADGTPAQVRARRCPATAPLRRAGLGGPGRPGAAAAARLRRRGQPEPLREVTDRLYGGTTEHRLRQELLLGVGGVRALRAYARITGAPAPEVFHTNEGHAGFLGLERIRELTVDRGRPAARLRRPRSRSPAPARSSPPTRPVPGRHRPLPARAGRAVLRRRTESVAGVPVDRILAPRRRGLRRRRPAACSTWR